MIKKRKNMYPLLLCFCLLLAGAGCSGANPDDLFPFLEVEKSQWQGYPMESIRLPAEDGSSIPLIIIKPADNCRPRPAVLLLHGMSGSKEAFTTIDSYGNCDNLTKLLLEEGFTVAAPDLRMHGERAEKEYPDYDAYLGDVLANWETFYAESLSDLNICLDYLKIRGDIKPHKIGTFGYSLGGIFTYVLAADPQPKIRTAVTAVSVFVWPEGTPFSGQPINQVENITMPILIQAAIHDDEFNVIENADTLFELIPAEKKGLLKYNSDHDLIIEYIYDTAEWYNTYL